MDDEADAAEAGRYADSNYWTHLMPHRTLGLLAALMICSSDSWMSAQQPAGRIAGTVVDLNGGALPGASVSLRRTGQGVSATTAARNDGRFVFDHVPAGTYSVDVDFPPFDAARRNNVIIAGATQMDVALKLKLSTICECVTYAAAPTARPEKWAMIRGVVQDSERRPLLHASLNIKGGPSRPSRAWSGTGGEFIALLPVDTACELVVNDSAFEGAIIPLTVREENADIRMQLAARPNVQFPDMEEFPQPCRCESDLFQHSGR